MTPQDTYLFKIYVTFKICYGHLPSWNVVVSFGAPYMTTESMLPGSRETYFSSANAELSHPGWPFNIPAEVLQYPS